jgi:HEAT repeat protein
MGKRALLENWRDTIQRVSVANDALSVPILIRALSHHNAGVRWVAVKVLGVIGNTQAVPSLLELLSKEKGNKWERMIVDLINALGVIGDSRACSSLNDLLSYPDNDVSREARDALQQISMFPALVDSLKSNDWHIRSEAASTLCGAGWRPKNAKQNLMFCLGNQDFESLVSIGAPAVPSLLEVLRIPEAAGGYWDRRKVVETLAKIGSPEVIHGLSAIWIEGKNTSDWKFNELVAEALFKLKWQPQSIEERLRFHRQIGKGFTELDEIGKSAVPEILESLKAEF